jgi:hypothetical protein
VHIVLTDNCTADGVIDLAGGWFDLGNRTDDGLLEATRSHMREQEGIRLGRATFESFGGSWPNQIDDSTGITDTSTASKSMCSPRPCRCWMRADHHPALP